MYCIAPDSYVLFRKPVRDRKEKNPNPTHIVPGEESFLLA